MGIKKIDKLFLGIVIALIIIGIIIFTSASLGILAKNNTKFFNVIISQFLFGLGGGFIAFYFGFRIPYKFWKKYSIYLFLASIILTVLVFIPGIGIAHKGAVRWISFLGNSFQPVEFLKVGFIIYFAAWLSWIKGNFSNFYFNVLPPIILFIIITLILIKQPDTKNIILITITALAMLIVSGISWKYILGLGFLAFIASILLISFKPHLMERVKTFINPNQDVAGSSYQLQQSLIAVGSGGLIGRGLGQSIQKFAYLPEPQGDSVFAVFAEELGFLGCIVLIILYLAFTFRGYRIALYAPDSFAKILVFGIITIIITQSFMNIASIVGVFPLTGVPLVFISHGGTALLLSLGMMGIVLNISSHSIKK